MNGKNKVLLIYPGKYQKTEANIPLSVLSLAGPLQESGFEVLIIDQRVNKDWEVIIEDSINDAIFAGLSTLTGNTILYGLEIAKFIRKINSKVPLVWGGVHPTIATEQTLENEFVDIVVKSEGEITAVELAECINKQGDLSSVDGISFKRGNRIFHNQDREFLNLDELPDIPYNLLDASKYTLDTYFHYQSARGCPHRCEFCDVIAFHRRLWRFKSVEKTLAELGHIIEKYHPENIEFVDDNFFANRRRAEEICKKIIENGFKFGFLVSCRADYFSRFTTDFLKLVKEAGCKEIYVGAESGSQRILDLINKDTNVEDIIDAAEKLVSVGIKMSCNFMSGFPEETKEDIQKTIELMYKLRKIGKSQKQIHIGGILTYTPYPGTPMFHKVINRGFIPPSSFESWGRFIMGDKNNITWYQEDHIRYIYTLFHITRDHEGWDKISLLILAKQTIRLGIVKGTIYTILRYLSMYRWKHRCFRLTLDVKLLAFVRKYFFKVG